MRKFHVDRGTLVNLALYLPALLFLAAGMALTVQPMRLAWLATALGGVWFPVALTLLWLSEPAVRAWCAGEQQDGVEWLAITLGFLWFSLGSIVRWMFEPVLRLRAEEPQHAAAATEIRPPLDIDSAC